MPRCKQMKCLGQNKKKQRCGVCIGPRAKFGYCHWHDKGVVKNLIHQYVSDALYEQLRFLHDFLTDKKVTYWISSGTLLGGVRHGGLIPWDDDNDIAIMDQDVKYLSTKPVRDEIRSYGYNWTADHKNARDITNFQLKNRYLPYGFNETPGTDVFVMKKVGGKLVYKDRDMQAEFGDRCTFDPGNRFHDMKFGNFTVVAPESAANTGALLDTCYPNWKRQWKIDDGHMDFTERFEPREGYMRGRMSQSKRYFKLDAPEITSEENEGILVNSNFD